jgi:hypothetical protein
MFRTDLVSIIRSLNTAFTAISFCNTISLPGTCRVVYQNKVEKDCTLAFIIRIYQDARSPECQEVEHPLLYWFLGQKPGPYSVFQGTPCFYFSAWLLTYTTLQFQTHVIYYRTLKPGTRYAHVT